MSPRLKPRPSAMNVHLITDWTSLRTQRQTNTLTNYTWGSNKNRAVENSTGGKTTLAVWTGRQISSPGMYTAAKGIWKIISLDISDALIFNWLIQRIKDVINKIVTYVSSFLFNRLIVFAWLMFLLLLSGTWDMFGSIWWGCEHTCAHVYSLFLIYVYNALIYCILI